MKLTGLHLLLTYQCTNECDHCFVWSSPASKGIMNITDILKILHQAKDINTIEWIYFEGGEPFLFYPVLLQGVKEAVKLNFKVGIVSNSYWAASLEDAFLWLKPLAGIISDLSLSDDPFHKDEEINGRVEYAVEAARRLNIPKNILSSASYKSEGNEIDLENSDVMFKGRAAEKLSQYSYKYYWESFNECTAEELVAPERLHVDSFGNIHICQGISIGNIFNTSLAKITAGYNPEEIPIINTLINGGPAELVRKYKLPHRLEYADACHLCYLCRELLQSQFPDVLTPPQVYGA